MMTLSAVTLLTVLCAGLTLANAVASNVTCPRAADILLVLDQSTIIVVGDPNLDNWYVRVLGFAKGVAGAFPIGRNLTQVAVIKFSSGVEIVFNLNACIYSNRESLLNAIDNIDINGGERNYAAALRSGRAMFAQSRGARNAVPKILIMLTVSRANREDLGTEVEANITKAAGIIIYTVGVGIDVNKDQLTRIASKHEYFFFATNYTMLNNVWPYLVENVCMTLTTTTIDLGNEANLQFKLSDFTNTPSLVNAIRRIPYFGGNTNTTGGLRLARTQIFNTANGDRSDVQNVIVLITDGNPTREIDTLPDEVLRVKISSIKIFGVGVTNAVNETILRSIVTNPLRDYLIVTDFATLNAQMVINEVCRTQPQPTTPPYVGDACRAGQFECNNTGRCISAADNFCDGKDNCGDSSDEPVNCTTRGSTQHKKTSTS